MVAFIYTSLIAGDENSPVKVVGFTGPGPQSHPLAGTQQAMSIKVSGNGSGVPQKMCTACGTKAANPGHSWCERCFSYAKAQKQ